MMVGKNTDDNYCKILDAMDEDEAVAFVSKKVKETIESCQKLQQAVDLKKLKRRDPTKYQKQLHDLIIFGLKIYTAEGLSIFLSSNLPEFGGLSGYEMIAEGRFDTVKASLSADYEGFGT
jgi:galactokinase